MHRDNNMRAAVIHVVADAAVSVLVIVGLALAYAFRWNWMDPLAGIVGALVIASWSYGLIRDTGAILLDVNPEPKLAERIRQTLESDGDRVSDLPLWRLGPSHLGAIASISTTRVRDANYYRRKLAGFRSSSRSKRGSSRLRKPARSSSASKAGSERRSRRKSICWKQG